MLTTWYRAARHAPRERVPRAVVWLDHSSAGRLQQDRPRLRAPVVANPKKLLGGCIDQITVLVPGTVVSGLVWVSFLNPLLPEVGWQQFDHQRSLKLFALPR